jgi:uncharacterized protein HemY
LTAVKPERDNVRDAKAELNRAMALDPQLAEAHYALGIVHWQDGDFAQAAREMQAAIDLRPDYTDVAVSAGVMHLGWKHGVCAGDHNNDAWEDLPVPTIRCA